MIRSGIPTRPAVRSRSARSPRSPRFPRSPRATSLARMFPLAALAATMAVFGCAGPEADSNGAPEGSDGAEESAPAAAGEAFEPEVILITGSTGGLGRAVALEMGSAGAHVIVHGRDRERGAEVVRRIEEEGVGSARFIRADLASFDEVRELARTIRADYDRLDVLVNNAGIGRGADETRRQVSADGHELRFQVNYLSGFLLTHELLPLLRESAPSRIVNVASAAQAAIDFDDVMLEESYNGSRAYSQSKLAQILFTFDLAEELDGTGVTVNALHPASLMPTGMVLERGAEPRSPISEGVEAVLNLVRSPEIGSGRYFRGTEPARADDQAYDEEARRQLRELSRELTGLQE